MVEPGLKNTAKKVVNYGSINIDHVYRVPHFVQAGETLNAQNLISGLGGKGANQSVAPVSYTHLTLPTIYSV